MGQYWLVCNLDKKEYINPHRLGAGLKLWEQLANHPGTGAALIVLCAAHREQRGGGDFDIEENWHGPERKFPEHSTAPGPMPDDYPSVARRTIGRWAGDRIALVGDYAEDGDLPNSPVPASKIYELCDSGEFRDISDDVAHIIEHELGGQYEGKGWRDWTTPRIEEQKMMYDTARAALQYVVSGFTVESRKAVEEAVKKWRQQKKYKKEKELSL